MGYVSIPADISSKLNKVPDYDSGCFSISSSAYVEKTHNFNTYDMIVEILWGSNDTDCINAVSGAGALPSLAMFVAGSEYYQSYLSHPDKIQVRNKLTSTRYFRILIWKGH